MTWLVWFVSGSDGIHELRHAFSAGAGSVFAGCVCWPGREMSLPVPGSSDGAAVGISFVRLNGHAWSRRNM